MTAVVAPITHQGSTAPSVSREPGTNECLKITGNNVILFGVKGQSVIKQIPNVASGTTSCAVRLARRAEHHGRDHVVPRGEQNGSTRGWVAK